MIESERSSDQEEADDWRSTRGLLVGGDGTMGRLLMDEDVSRVAGVIGIVDDGWDMMKRDSKMEERVEPNLVLSSSRVKKFDLPMLELCFVVVLGEKSDGHVNENGRESVMGKLM